MPQEYTVSPVHKQQANLFATAAPVTNNRGMTLGNRIKRARERLGMSQAALAEAAGMRQQSLSALEAGKSASTTRMLALAEALKVSVPWLERGETSFSLPAGYVPEPAADKEVRLRKHSEAEHLLDDWVAAQGVTENHFLRTQQGAAMEPTLYDGDSVLINFGSLSSEIVDGGVYLVARDIKGHGSIQRFRRLRETASGDLVILCDNPDKMRFPDEIVQSDQRSEFVVIGKAEFRAGRIR